MNLSAFTSSRRIENTRIDKYADRYDADTHLLQPRLNTSPLMKQRVARLKGINDTYNASRNGLQSGRGGDGGRGEVWVVSFG